MPALVLFGRRWLLASDDVPLPAAACALFHGVWSILLVVWFVSVHGPAECSGAWRYDVAVGGLLAAFVLSCGLELGMVRHGLQGGPFETRRRRLVPRLLYLDLASHITQVAFNAYSTWLLYDTRRPQCEGGEIWDPFAAMAVLVWFTWAVMVALLLLLVLTYNLFPDYSDPRSWERRCNCIGTLCCCCHRKDQLYTDGEGKPQRITSRLGNIFATLFSHIDLSATDMFLAFSLAMILQRIQRKQQGGGAGSYSVGGAGGGAGTDDTTAAAAGAAGRQQRRPGGDPSSQQTPGGSGRHIQLSTQSSPNCTGSVCSADDLLSQAAELETGLLAVSRRRLLRPQVSSSGGTARVEARAMPGEASKGRVSADELRRTSQFTPAHPQGGGLQFGAGKRQGGEAGDEQEDGEQQEEEEVEGHGHPTRHGKGSHCVDSETLQEAAWAMKFAFAGYGYLLFIFSAPTMGCLQLLFGRNCGLLVGTANGRQVRKKLDLRLVHNLNREATQQAAGLADKDLLDVRYEGEVPHVLPYFIAVDEATRTLVLAIRGSLSLEDVVRDLLFEPASLDEWVAGGRRWEDPPPELHPASASTRYAAHAGILEAARATFLDIQLHGVLHDALLSSGGRCRGYQLCVTGHSLGAGCAYLLALWLRHFFPNLRCWAFSPPGGLASAGLGAASADWCTSVVCGKEWIPRLSVRTFQRMRDEMVYAALRCKKPKWVVLLGLMAGRKWREGELFYGPDELPMEAREALRRYNDSVQLVTATRSFIGLAEDFQPPGRCFQLRPTGLSSRHGGCWRRTKRRQYRAVWVDAEAIIDQGILISGRMMADHMPDYALATLRRLAYSMRHSKSTAHVSDSAGERLTDDIMEHGGEGDDDEGTEGGSPGSSRNWSSRRQSPRAMAATVPPAPQPAMRRPGGGSASLLPV